MQCVVCYILLPLNFAVLSSLFIHTFVNRHNATFTSTSGSNLAY